jgi:hypothetical protein
MKVAELEGALLDYWVAQCNPPDRAPGEWHKLVPHSRGTTCYYVGRDGDQRAIYAPSSRWEQGGPIIERERIQTVPQNVNHLRWSAYIDEGLRPGQYAIEEFGATLLEAAMRAYVTKAFGEEVQDAQPESVG